MLSVTVWQSCNDDEWILLLLHCQTVSKSMLSLLVQLCFIDFPTIWECPFKIAIHDNLYNKYINRIRNIGFAMEVSMNIWNNLGEK